MEGWHKIWLDMMMFYPTFCINLMNIGLKNNFMR
jgi:hypothetical protein